MVDEARDRPLAGKRERRRGGGERGAVVVLEHRATDVLAEAVYAAAAEANMERDALGRRGRLEALERVRLDREGKVGDAVPQGLRH
jgi:hypothetical protein